MQSVLDVLKKTEAYFSKAELESPKVNAEWILAETLGCKRLDLYLQWERPLEETVLQTLRERVQRRAAGEPLEYIIGNVEFHQVRLDVAAGVLIPRKETEQLVEHVLARLQDVATPRIVDLGTGSGAIAIALAHARKDAKVLAVDSSRDALKQARANARKLGLRERISFRQGNWLDGLAFEADCIVSNPPYLTEDEWQSANPDVRLHEPREALVAGENGSADLKLIMEQAFGRLADGAFLALEMGIAHGSVLLAHAKGLGYKDCRVLQDDSGRDRFFLASR